MYRKTTKKQNVYLHLTAAQSIYNCYQFFDLCCFDEPRILCDLLREFLCALLLCTLLFKEIILVS